MHPSRVTLTGPQLTELMGVARIQPTAVGGEYLELAAVFRIHYLIPLLAHYLATRARNPPVAGDFLGSLRRAPAPTEPDFVRMLGEQNHERVAIRNIVTFMWGAFLA